MFKIKNDKGLKYLLFLSDIFKIGTNMLVNDDEPIIKEWNKLNCSEQNSLLYSYNETIKRNPSQKKEIIIL